MADIFSKRQRSRVMSRIRSRGNATTEAVVASLLRSAGLTGWRRHQKPVSGAGAPDFVFRKARICIFVDGCFWHGCPRCFRAPTSNVAYWSDKIVRNRRRDRRNRRALRAAGFKVVRIWECELKKPAQAEKIVAKLSALMG